MSQMQGLPDVDAIALEVTQQLILNAAASLYAVRVDEASSTVTYVGYAAAGSNTASAVWRLKRITISGTETIVEWCDGNTNFDNTYSGRATHSYS